MGTSSVLAVRNVKYKKLCACLLCAAPLVWSDHVVSRAFSKTLGLFFPHSLFRYGAASSLSAYMDDITNHIPLNIAVIGRKFGFFQPIFSIPFFSQKKKPTNPVIWNQNNFQRETSSLSLLALHIPLLFCLYHWADWPHLKGREEASSWVHICEQCWWQGDFFSRVLSHSRFFLLLGNCTWASPSGPARAPQELVHIVSRQCN